MSNLKLGKKGEEIAKKYLIQSGYKVIDTNVRFSRFCEIDIIAVDKKTLVFVEVKTRNSLICGHPFEAITKTKFNHIRQGVLMYLKENNGYKNYRIDAISVLLSPELKIEHLKNISL